MTRYTLHVPLQLNDGAPVDADTLATIESDLLDLAGGFTATEGIGAWRGNGGHVYREPVRLYHVDTAEPDAPELLAALASSVARWLDQEAVYLTAAPLATQLLTAVPA